LNFFNVKQRRKSTPKASEISLFKFKFSNEEYEDVDVSLWDDDESFHSR
jgi:hypothetical protein